MGFNDEADYKRIESFLEGVAGQIPGIFYEVEGEMHCLEHPGLSYFFSIPTGRERLTHVELNLDLGDLFDGDIRRMKKALPQKAEGLREMVRRVDHLKERGYSLTSNSVDPYTAVGYSVSTPTIEDFENAVREVVFVQ